MELVIFTAQGSPYQWACIGWMRREGDYQHVWNCRVFEVLGASLSDLEAGPAPQTKLYRMTKRERYHELHVQRVIFTDPAKWAELVPKPEAL